jgi:hypothetical protein
MLEPPFSPDQARRADIVIPGGLRSRPGREARLWDDSGKGQKVWIPFPALRAAGDDTGGLDSGV